jgi:molybdopterin/thiamine biosynthesis adenylyltransferase
MNRPELVRFRDVKNASGHLKPSYDQALYLERTRRNHHWLGGPAGQARLHDFRVAVAGLGGMGSNIAEMLVRLGVGHIKIADPDTIELSNLNRQVIANRNTVGHAKVAASVQELRNVAEDFELVWYADGVTQDNAEEFVSEVDVLIDEVDVFPLQVHAALHRAARSREIPVYSGFIIGMGAHIYKFFGSDYTLEDFLLRDQGQIASPSAEFLADRFINPPPSYLSRAEDQASLMKGMHESGLPIFGASTYAAQSILVIRVIADYLNLHAKLGSPPTPIMPEFIKFDPIDMVFKPSRVDSPAGAIR